MITLFVNKYVFFEWIYFLDSYKYIISLKVNKYNSLKLHKCTVAVYIFFWMWIYAFLDFCIIYKWPTIVNYDLLVLYIPCEQGPLVYPRKMFMCPHDESAIIPEVCFSLKSSNRGCNFICADVLENRLPETRNNILANALSVLDCPNMFSCPLFNTNQIST